MLELVPRDFLILLINFLGLLIALNYILFKPLLKLFKEREDNVNGSLAVAKNMTQKKDDAIARLNKELSDARDKAKATYESLRTDGLNKQKDVFSKAEAEASEILQKARAELKAEAGKARQNLRADVDRFSDEIVIKLVKV